MTRRTSRLHRALTNTQLAAVAAGAGCSRGSVESTGTSGTLTDLAMMANNLKVRILAEPGPANL